ncbi:MAG: CHAT domain-containing protein, partial [Saprospiraceae bacterium]
NLKNLGLKYYQLAIDISYLLNDQNRFWYFSEKTKGLQLLKSHVKRRNGTGTGRQQSIIDSIKRSVVLLETEIYQASKANKTELESRLSTNRAQIVTLQREALNKDQSIKPYDLATMIDILDREELVLQYQYGRENLYLQIVNNSRSYIEKIGKSDSINSSILKMREVITESVSTMNEFDEISSSLYNSLVLNKLSDRSELFIIPDRELFYLPFEILRENDSEPYLIEDYDVSYLPSGSFRLPDSDHTDIDEIIVYKPNYIEGSNSIPPLPFIDAEIASIKRAFKIELISQNDDLSVDFLQIIKQAQVLHFGGHAILDGDNNEQSYLALGHGEDSNSRLRLGELYTAECGSELVTLSACNTGMGGILDGEGISSITRGFLYSGARAVVNTLWTVDDQSTSSIIGLFYEYLKQGKSKSHALRLAKLEYLQQAETYRRHPYYWAGVIGMGDMSQPIVYPTNWIKVILTIIMAVALTWFLTWRFNEKPMRKIVFLSDWEGLVNDRKKK